MEGLGIAILILLVLCAGYATWGAKLDKLFEKDAPVVPNKAPKKAVKKAPAKKKATSTNAGGRTKKAPTQRK